MHFPGLCPVVEEAVVVVGANISFMNDMWAGVGPRIEIKTNIREFSSFTIVEKVLIIPSSG